MNRDRGPIDNLGYGVTSRDMPYADGETEGPSPDSGVLSKRLEGHPIMRFVAHTGASIAVAGVMTAVFKKRWIKVSSKIR